MATGAGKTRTGVHLVANHLIDHEPTSVIRLAQNVELPDQAADEAAAQESTGAACLSAPAGKVPR